MVNFNEELVEVQGKLLELFKQIQKFGFLTENANIEVLVFEEWLLDKMERKFEVIVEKFLSEKILVRNNGEIGYWVKGLVREKCFESGVIEKESRGFMV